MRMVAIGAALTLAFVWVLPAAGETAPPASPGTSPWQGSRPDGSASVELQVYDGLTIEELEAMVQGTGVTVTPGKTPSGIDILNAVSPDGLNFAFYLVDCAEGSKRCRTLNIDSNLFLATTKVTLKGINDWNAQTWGARGFLHKDGSSEVIANYGIDGGITSGWVKNRTADFLRNLSSFSAYVGSGIATPNPTP